MTRVSLRSRGAVSEGGVEDVVQKVQDDDVEVEVEGLEKTAGADDDDCIGSPLLAYERELGGQDSGGFGDLAGPTPGGCTESFAGRRHPTEPKHDRVITLATTGPFIPFSPKLADELPGRQDPAGFQGSAGLAPDGGTEHFDGRRQTELKRDLRWRPSSPRRSAAYLLVLSEVKQLSQDGKDVAEILKIMEGKASMAQQRGVRHRSAEAVRQGVAYAQTVMTLKRLAAMKAA